MPVAKHKPTTRSPGSSTPESSSPVVPEQEEFRQHPQVFERYARYEPEVVEALTDMFVSGTSTHRVGKVAENLLGVAPSTSTVSRLTQTLTEQ